MAGLRGGLLLNTPALQVDRLREMQDENGFIMLDFGNQVSLLLKVFRTNKKPQQWDSLVFSLLMLLGVAATHNTRAMAACLCASMFSMFCMMIPLHWQRGLHGAMVHAVALLLFVTLPYVLLI